MHKPFFSVVLPTYNRVNFLPTTIASVLNQSFESLELIIVDDGSSDDTESLVRSFIQQDPRITYIRQLNQERGSARNNGIRCARGDWISFLDSDDHYLPSHLSELYTFISQSQDCTLVGFKAMIESETGMIYSEACKFKSVISFPKLLRGNPVACNFAVANRPSSLVPFQECRSLCSMEDWIFLLTLVPATGLPILSDPTVIMSDHDGRSMHANKTVILKRQNAANYINNYLRLSRSSQNSVMAGSYLFCSIHSYLDFNRADSIRFLLRSWTYSLPSVFSFLLFLKFILGRSSIQYIRNIFLCLKYK